MRNIIGKLLLAVSLFAGQLPSAFSFSIPIVWADDGVGVGSGITPSRIESIQESDGSPSVFPWRINTSNGTLTDNADGTATLANAGAPSGGFSSNRILYGDGTATPTTSASFLFDGTNLTFPSTGDLRPSADATNALNIANASGTDFVTFDTTNSFVGIGTTPGIQQYLHIAASQTGLNQVGLRVENTSTGRVNLGLLTNDVDVNLQVPGTGDIAGAAQLFVSTADALTFGTGNTEQVRLDTNGDVGIGTANPGYKLHVFGSAATDGITYRMPGTTQLGIVSQIENSAGSGVFDARYYGSAAAGTIGGLTAANSVAMVAQPGANQFGLGTFTNFPMVFWTNATEKARLTAAGRLGIGTAVPDSLLHVKSAALTNNYLGLEAVDAISDVATKYIDTTTGGPWYTGMLNSVVAGSGGYFIFGGTTANTKLFVSSAGNVGIGTVTPRALLHVGTVAPGAAFDTEQAGFYTDTTNGFPINVVFSAADATANAQGILFHKSRGSHASPTVVQSGDNLGNLTAWGYDGATRDRSSAINFDVDTTPGVNDMPGRIRFSTTADGASSMTERMRITNAGRFGFNTTAPSSVIHVVQPDGTSGAETGNITWISDAYSESLADRNVAFTARRARGTSAAPASLLADDRLLSISSQGWTTGTSFGEAALLRTYAAANHSSTSTPGYMTFWTTATSATSPTERMRIDSAGQVGIGLTSPGAPLHVATKNANNIVAALGASSQQTSGGEILILGQTSDIIGTAQGNAIWLIMNHAAASGTPNLLLRSTFRDNADANTSFVGSRMQFNKIAGANSSNIDFATTNASVTTDRMRITETGNVGIGDTTPDALLESNNGTSTSDIFIASDNDTPVLTVADGGAVTLTSTLTSSRTTDFGWTVVNAANQACNTTCTNACVVGIDTAALGNFLACTDATADSCLCAGSS